MRNTSAMAGSAESMGYGGEYMYKAEWGAGDHYKTLSHLRFFFFFILF